MWPSASIVSASAEASSVGINTPRDTAKDVCGAPRRDAPVTMTSLTSDLPTLHTALPYALIHHFSPGQG